MSTTRAVRHTKDAASDINAVERRTQVVDLARQAKSRRAIAAELGISLAMVQRDITAWVVEHQPSTEATDELRQLELDRIEGWSAKLIPAAFVDPLEPNLQVVDRLVKLSERKAKLMGLDLQRDINLHQHNYDMTALGAFFGWHSQDDVVEVEASSVEEITSGE